MTKLDNLQDKDWKDLKDIVIFGFGRQGKKMYPTLSKDFNIVAIVDNSPEKQGIQFDKHTILSFEQAQTLLHQYKVIVTASQYYYQAIREQLHSTGLVENIDFIMYQQFVTEWYYKYRNQVNVLKTIVILTNLCTLNCEHCMEFLPFWKEGRRKDNPLAMLKENAEIYFRCVDYLLSLDIVGGEPFLYRDLEQFITYIGENYRDKIGYVGFITNGMVVPNDHIFELMKEYSIDVSISDYSGNIEYAHKIDLLCEKLEQYSISYMRNTNIDWFDFGFPRDVYHFEGESAIKHMQCCNSIEHILDDKKLFYCGLEWSAQKGGLYPVEQKAYVDLEKVAEGSIDRKEILEMLLANIEGGCLDFCKVCGGFGIDNDNRIATAKQIVRAN